MYFSGFFFWSTSITWVIFFPDWWCKLQYPWIFKVKDVMWKLFIIDLVTWGNLFTKIQRNVWKSMICIVFHLLCTIWLLGLVQNFINVCIILVYILSVFFWYILSLKIIIATGSSPWNENLNWLVQIKFLNLFLYIFK